MDDGLTKAFDWATYSGDAWTRRWRELDVALADLAPKLHAAIVDALPARPFKAFDVGCGAGSTSEWLAHERPDATIVGCDLSPSLIRLATDRLSDLDSVSFRLGDAQDFVAREGPFDLIFSRHGVMFFDDPIAAFRAMRASISPGGALVFSCFQDWQKNPWASRLESAVAGKQVPSPGEQGGGFAFADPGHVRQILGSAGWVEASVQQAPFRYAAAVGDDATDKACEFLSDIGPAARALNHLPEPDRPAAVERMRSVIAQYRLGAAIEFPAAAWIWTARA